MQAWKNHEWHLWKLPCTLPISTAGGTGLCTAPRLPCLSPQSALQGYVQLPAYPACLHSRRHGRATPQPPGLSDCAEYICAILSAQDKWQLSLEKLLRGTTGYWPGKQGKMKLFCYRREMAPIGRQESWRQHARWDKPDTTGHYCGSSLTGAATTSKAVGQEGKMCAGAGEGGTDSREDSIILQVEFLPWDWTRQDTRLERWLGS